MSKDSKKVILYPSQSYIFQYSLIPVLLIILQLQIFFAIYKNTLTIFNALLLGIPVTISLIYVLFHLTTRKIIISQDAIENVRAFPVQSQRLHFVEIKSYKLYNSINFGGGRTGSINGIIFQKADIGLVMWNIAGFDTREIQKYLSQSLKNV